MDADTQKVIETDTVSADPGRRKGERVREKEVLHCYYYYYYYYDDDYYYDYYYDLVASSSFTAML